MKVKYEAKQNYLVCLDAVNVWWVRPYGWGHLFYNADGRLEVLYKDRYMESTGQAASGALPRWIQMA